MRHEKKMRWCETLLNYKQKRRMRTKIWKDNHVCLITSISIQHKVHTHVHTYVNDMIRYHHVEYLHQHHVSTIRIHIEYMISHHHNTTQHNTTQCYTSQYNKLQYNTIQYKHITLQHNTIQHHDECAVSDFLVIDEQYTRN